MASDKSDDAKIPLTGLLILLTVLGGILYYQQPFKSERPVNEQQSKAVIVGDKRVQSRLWQDPFTSVKAHKNAEADSRQSQTVPIAPHPPSPSTEGSPTIPQAKNHHDLRIQLSEIIKTTGESKPTFKVLIVVTEGTPFASGTEYRLRHRYALVSALGETGYVPEAGEFFRYFSWDRIRLQGKDICWNEGCPSLDVPLEWFKPQVTEKDHVLVLWVKDQELDKKPLASLEGLVAVVKDSASISQKRQDRHNSVDATMSFTVLGPFHSGTLRAMISEVLGRHKMAPPSNTSTAESTPIQYLSYSATASEAVLFEGLNIDKAQCSTEAQCWEYMKSLGFDMHRVIGTDELLAKKLVEELQQRRVDPHQGDHIALIGEWDTLYGRKLPLTFVQETKDPQALNLLTKIKNLKDAKLLNWAHRFSYLRGIDGELPQSVNASGGKSESEGTASQNFFKINKSLERPEGPSQFDYLRRLALQIKEEDRKIREKCMDKPGEGSWPICPGFKAMGILAGDVYDKLLLLQALRKEFPGVIFFTTDLDARLLHPGQYQWTRNLLIASHFGLRLPDTVQGSIPPFRDAYQTSLFLSASLAIDPVTVCRRASSLLSHGVCENSPNTSSDSREPRIFEVGLTGAYDLSADSGSMHVSAPDVENGELPPLISLRTFVLLGCILLGSWLIYAAMSRRAVFLFQKAGQAPLFWIFLFAVVGFYAWLYVSITNQLEHGEPFVWLEGISVWPTELLRLGAFFLSLWFLCRGYRTLQSKFREIEAEFNLQSGQCSGFFEWKKWLEFGPDFSKGSPPPHNTVHETWRVYTSLMGLRCAGSRVFAQTAVYLLLFAFPVFLLLGFPTTPCRGETCFHWDKGILILSVVTMWLLVFFVIYAARLGARMVDWVLQTGVQWPSRQTARAPWFHSSMNDSLTNIQHSLRFCGQLTEVVGTLIYYPFIIVLIMIVSRSSFFDDWDLPISLLIVLGSNIGLAIFSAFHFRQTAEHARGRVLNNLSSMLSTNSGSREKSQVQKVINEVQNFKKGSFCPFAEQPILKAFAIPSGGYFLMIFIEYLGR
ncbi:MAG: hypothetical protein MRJ67_11640 [Nitrospirales bacterium]|nr:hypothetical protein [Nitrospirales bacterium]